MLSDELVLDDPAVLETLYDPVRFRVFGLLEEPRSVAEVAAELDVPSNRLYYHVRRLVESGLVRQVDVRARGRHTERLYRRAGRISFSGDVRLPPGEGGPVQAIAAELDAGLRSRAVGLVSFHEVRLTPERARELEERLQELFAEFTEDNGPDRFAVLGVLAARA